MKRIAVLCFLAVLLPVGSAIASVPPEIPPSQMPPAYRPDVPIPPLYLPPALPDPAGPMTVERLKHMTVSGLLYHALSTQAAANAGAPTATATTDSTIDPAAPVFLQRARTFAAAADSAETTSTLHGASSGFHVLTNASSGTTVNVSTNGNTDTAQDAEPTIAAVNISGTVHTTTVATKFEPCWNNSAVTCTTLYAYHTTNLSTYTGPIRLSMPINHLTRQPAWDSMGDPLMSVNPYTGGVWGKRMYCSGLLFNQDGTGSSAIAVWHSDNGGLNWSDAALVEVVGGGVLADKPAIAVSWQQNPQPGQSSSSLGYVYVAYMTVTSTSSQNQLRVGVSTDGGVGFTPVTVTTANVQFPQVVIDPQGTVNPIWVNLGTSQIQTTQSHDYGATYGGTPFEVITGTSVISNGTVPGFAAGRANSVPMARYNAAAGRICLVYYGRTGSTYEIFYTYKPGCAAPNCNAGGWPTTPVQLTTSANADNNYFDAALDFNKTTGNLIVPYYRSYATTDGFGNKTYYYDEYAASITASGSLLQTLTLSPNSSSANLQVAYAGFVGDYQDAWDDLYASEQVVSAWIGGQISPSTSDHGDDCVTPVSY